MSLNSDSNGVTWRSDRVSPFAVELPEAFSSASSSSSSSSLPSWSSTAAGPMQLNFGAAIIASLDASTVAQVCVWCEFHVAMPLSESFFAFPYSSSLAQISRIKISQRPHHLHLLTSTHKFYNYVRVAHITHRPRRSPTRRSRPRWPPRRPAKCGASSRCCPRSRATCSTAS